MRRSSSPCSFFAAWYSKFSERSPCAARGRDRLDDRLPLRALELGELGLELLVLRMSELLPLLLSRGISGRSRRSRRSNRRRRHRRA